MGAVAPDKAVALILAIIPSSDNICGHSSSVEYQLPKLRRRVRFPLPAPKPQGLKSLRLFHP